MLVSLKIGAFFEIRKALTEAGYHLPK